jgi:hypothetical protein
VAKDKGLYEDMMLEDSAHRFNKLTSRYGDFVNKDQLSFTQVMRVFKPVDAKTEIHQLQRVGTYDVKGDTTSWEKEEFCKYKKNGHCKTGQLRPGDSSTKPFEDFDPNKFAEAMRDCCASGDAKECSETLNEDEKFGLEAEVVKKSPSRNSRGSQ